MLRNISGKDQTYLFIELMTSTNKMIIRNLVSYVYEAFGVRYQ